MDRSSLVDIAGRHGGTSASRGGGVADVVGLLLALLLLPIAALPVALTALVVVASLGRPILFRQSRIGRDGRPFDVIKLRTMREAHDGDGRLLPDEARLTPVMRVVRRMRLDELPQIVNLLSADMAVVGPRPLTPATVAAFGALGAVRCRVRPGVTGWAQVNGNTRLTDDDKLALDVWYVDHRSFGLDLLIVCRTVATILFGERVHASAIAEAQRHLAERYGSADFGGGR